jgi:hypothetical protein
MPEQFGVYKDGDHLGDIYCKPLGSIGFSAETVRFSEDSFKKEVQRVLGSGGKSINTNGIEAVKTSEEIIKALSPKESIDAGVLIDAEAQKLLDKWGVQIKKDGIYGVKAENIDGPLIFDENTKNFEVTNQGGDAVVVHVNNLDGTKDEVIIKGKNASILSNVR